MKENLCTKKTVPILHFERGLSRILSPAWPSENICTAKKRVRNDDARQSGKMESDVERMRYGEIPRKNALFIPITSENGWHFHSCSTVRLAMSRAIVSRINGLIARGWPVSLA